MGASTKIPACWLSSEGLNKAGGVQGRGRSQPAQCWIVPLASRQIHHPVIHPEMGKTAELSYDRRVGSFELLKITAREAKWMCSLHTPPASLFPSLVLLKVAGCFAKLIKSCYAMFFFWTPLLSLQSPAGGDCLGVGYNFSVPPLSSWCREARVELCLDLSGSALWAQLGL